ncbi:probable tubulin polyglutamylase TTLL2 [Orycteropus afer afer]|uniref:Probable tubulin polyglutamylase TTLL2 n=1 Tax=Orycteropus afer afer TaxID=1230840 RepID=A0A8B7AL03_ORYAF|nr:probable tubulin polyglutamylase TTLL2 [Orycteropus afer afer]
MAGSKADAQTDQASKRNPDLTVEDGRAGAVMRPPVFRVDETTPEVVQSVLLERGWNKFDERTQDVEDWNLYWRVSPFPMIKHAHLKPWQRLNHHPGTTRLTRKDDLAKLLTHMKRLYGASLYEFIPLTFIMPSDYHKFMAEYSKERQTLGTKPSYWICKPAELSRGRGIMIFSDTKDLVFDHTYVVQKYICNPLLVGKYKCDLRIYVCVTGFKPLTIYIYQEGLVRFATEKFDLRHLQNDYAHLTNSSINTLGASYRNFKEVVGQGCKWTLSRFFSYLRSCDVDDLLLWRKITHLVILTVLAIAPSVPCAANCFELFGFDVLIDDNLKPWLLEVNYSPALSLHCSTDVSVKRKLIHDIIELIHVTSPRNKGSGHVSRGDASVSSARSGRGGLRDVRGALPRGSLLQISGTVFAKRKPAMEKAERTWPKNTRTSQLRERMNKQEGLAATRELPKLKPRSRSRHTPRKSCSPRPPQPPAQPCKASGSPAPLPGSREELEPQAGNFVLIFPFNEATFGASRNGLNVKRIIQELQKLMNEPQSRVAESETNRRRRGAWKPTGSHPRQVLAPGPP